MIPKAEIDSERFLTFKRSKYPELGEEVVEAARRIVERQGYTVVSVELVGTDKIPDEWAAKIKVTETVGPFRFLRRLLIAFITLWFPVAGLIWLGAVLALIFWGPDGWSNFAVMIASLWFARWHLLRGAEWRDRGYTAWPFLIGALVQLGLAGLQVWMLLAF